MMKHRELLFAIASGIMVGVALLFESFELSYLAITMFVAAYLIGGYYKAKEGLMELIHEKKLSVEILMILAAIGAAMIGNWMEGAILIFIFALSGALETYTMNKSEKELSQLMSLQPDEATILENGVEKIIPSSSIEVGQLVVVRAGERIAADGKIIKGESAIDESAITGESIPVQKGINDHVYSGTVCLTSTLTIEVTKKATETLFQKIIEMVQSAREEYSPSQQFIERYEGLYVKIVLLMVALMMIVPHYLVGWSFTESFYRAMVMLVVASPCALVASVMPATLSAIANGAKQGILFKGGAHIEQLGHIKAIGFDKTGTITNGTPQVTNVYMKDPIDTPEFFATVAAIEAETNHPLAQAIADYCLAHTEVACTTVAKVETVSGFGLEAIVGETSWKIGKRDYFGDQLVNSFFPEETKLLLNEGKTLVYVGNDEEIFALFALEDTVRDEAIPALDHLRQLGITTYMITGDHESTAKAIAAKTHIDHYAANCLPNEKVDEIKKMRKKYKQIAMVGDGINDAPALAVANVGIAMGAGTDAAIETADVVLMKNDLTKIPQAIELAKRMNRVIKQNMVFSTAVIILLMIGNFMQEVSLPFGVIGHEGSTILVILNGLRLLKH